MTNVLREPAGHLQQLQKALAILMFSVRQRARLLGGVLVRTVLVLLMISIFAQLWRAVHEAGLETPSGFSQAQLLWYLAVTEAIIFSSPQGWGLEVDREVRSGDIAYRLARPVAYPLYQLAVSLGDRLVRWGACLVLGGVVAWLCVGSLAWSGAALAASLFTSLLALLLDELVVLTISLSSFWIENTWGLHLLWRRAVMLLGGAFLPIHAYPSWLAALSEALPLKLIAAGPARLLVARDASELPSLLGAQLGFGALALAALLLVFQVGRRRVSAQGG